MNSKQLIATLVSQRKAREEHPQEAQVVCDKGEVKLVIESVTYEVQTCVYTSDIWEAITSQEDTEYYISGADSCTPQVVELRIGTEISRGALFEKISTVDLMRELFNWTTSKDFLPECLNLLEDNRYYIRAVVKTIKPEFYKLCRNPDCPVYRCGSGDVKRATCPTCGKDFAMHRARVKIVLADGQQEITVKHDLPFFMECSLVITGTRITDSLPNSSPFDCFGNGMNKARKIPSVFRIAVKKSLMPGSNLELVLDKYWMSTK